MNAGHPRQAIDAMPFAERTALLEQAARKFRELHPDFEINRTPSIIRPPHHLKRNAERQFRCRSAVGFWRRPCGGLGCRRLLKMIEDRVGKLFIGIFTNGDLPTNPISLGECVVCGGVFTRDKSRQHSEVPCQPSSEQPFAIITS
jgi:hypothetical protein